MSETRNVLPVDLMNRLTSRIEAEMGLSFSLSKRRDLEKAISRMAVSKLFANEKVCANWLLEQHWNKEKSDLCAQHLTIGETYFCREPRALELVCTYAREKLREAGTDVPPLRIWSAGCCTGEEPYSIAMALSHGAPKFNAGRLSILATDINPHHLEFARNGVYRQWSFRNREAEKWKRHFFEDIDGRFRIAESIRRQVRFAELNLARSAYPSIDNGTNAVDIIFCRNVLMYFSKSQARKVIKRFWDCLIDGGWLIVSPSEASVELFEGFSAVHYPEAVFFQKDGAVLPAAGRRDAGRDKVPHAIRTVASAARPGDIETGSRPCEPLAARPPSSTSTAPGTDAGNSAPRFPIDPRVDEAWGSAVAQARAFANNGQVGEAMDYLEKEILAHPEVAELHQAKGLVAMESGELYDATQSLKRALYLKPDLVIARYLMGVLHAAQSRSVNAFTQFKAVEELLEAMGNEEIVTGSEGFSAAYLRDSARDYMRSLAA
jgi:chemotaxis protein methyltransferase CheR